jgi:site-specific DNA-methyltransferase (adenine-specific)
MGSGTTLIAAAKNNRKSIGIDVDKEYCELAKNRIFNETDILNKKKEVIKTCQNAK